MITERPLSRAGFPSCRGPEKPQARQDCENSCIGSYSFLYRIGAGSSDEPELGGGIESGCVLSFWEAIKASPSLKEDRLESPSERVRMLSRFIWKVHHSVFFRFVSFSLVFCLFWYILEGSLEFKLFSAQGQDEEKPNLKAHDVVGSFQVDRKHGKQERRGPL